MSEQDNKIGSGSVNPQYSSFVKEGYETKGTLTNSEGEEWDIDQIEDSSDFGEITVQEPASKVEKSTALRNAFLVGAVALAVIALIAHHYQAPAIAQYLLMGGFVAGIVLSCISEVVAAREMQVVDGSQECAVKVNGEKGNLYGFYSTLHTPRTRKEMKIIQNDFKSWLTEKERSEEEIKQMLWAMHSRLGSKVGEQEVAGQDMNFALKVGDKIYVAADTFYAGNGKQNTIYKNNTETHVFPGYPPIGILMGKNLDSVQEQMKNNQLPEPSKSFLYLNPENMASEGQSKIN